MLIVVLMMSLRFFFLVFINRVCVSQGLMLFVQKFALSFFFLLLPLHSASFNFALAFFASISTKSARVIIKLLSQSVRPELIYKATPYRSFHSTSLIHHKYISWLESLSSAPFGVSASISHFHLAFFRLSAWPLLNFTAE
jgi:hypothetical protein